MKRFSWKNPVIPAAVIALAFFIFGFKASTFYSDIKNKNVENGEKRELSFLSEKTAAQKSKNAENAPREYSEAYDVSDSSFTQDEKQNIRVYSECAEAVVNINTQVVGVNWFLEPVVQNAGSGSGSIIDSRGYVLTNVHVIEGATKIYVSLSDGTQYEASVVGKDKESDLAVIKFNPPKNVKLSTISFGDSSALVVGQKVIAIGNPFGFERTMTTGIVSALNRPIKNRDNYIIRGMIQTDCAINPGNSGGPLLDTGGRMVGISTMIFSSSGSSAGIGFCVPANTALRVAKDLVAFGRVKRGKINCSIVQLNNTISEYVNLDISRGILISEVPKGTAAARAGLRGGSKAARYGSSIIYLGGDVIREINGVAVNTIAEYYAALEDKREGEKVELKIRRGAKDLKVEVELEELEERRNERERSFSWSF